MATELQNINNYLAGLNATFTIAETANGLSYKLIESDNTEHSISGQAYKDLSEEALSHFKTQQTAKEVSGDAKLKELLNQAKGVTPQDDNGQDGKD